MYFESICIFSLLIFLSMLSENNNNNNNHLHINNHLYDNGKHNNKIYQGKPE